VAEDNRALMVVFDASPNLTGAFRAAGFRPYGRQRGAWCRGCDPHSEEADDLTYELNGVGLYVKWRDTAI
jgi:hypothetical protein